MPGLTRMSSISAGRTIVVCADTTTAVDSHRRATDPIAALSQPRQRFTVCTRPPGQNIASTDAESGRHYPPDASAPRGAGCGVRGARCGAEGGLIVETV